MKAGLAGTLIAVIFCATVIMSAAGEEKSRTNDNRGRILNAIRLINTTQLYARQKGGSYLPLAQLLSSGKLEETARMNTDLSAAFDDFDLQNAAEPLHNLALEMLVSGDGKTYKLSLTEKSRCGMAFFSDEHGMIYQGKALGCSK